MNVAEILAGLRTTRHPPTDAEAEFIAREGTALEVGEALCFSNGTSKPLLKRYNADRRASQLPHNQGAL